ncbi:MAG: hypothetical protein KGQ58_07625 [Proteobacteria bacterium]|nr:hypothetical protein [Pseudomonadota bacterium]MDE3207820.1 hypothetical protein [Pseudomonadota bacterium]
MARYWGLNDVEDARIKRELSRRRSEDIPLRHSLSGSGTMKPGRRVLLWWALECIRQDRPVFFWLGGVMAVSRLVFDVYHWL